MFVLYDFYDTIDSWNVSGSSLSSFIPFLHSKCISCTVYGSVVITDVCLKKKTDQPATLKRPFLFCLQFTQIILFCRAAVNFHGSWVNIIIHCPILNANSDNEIEVFNSIFSGKLTMYTKLLNLLDSSARNTLCKNNKKNYTCTFQIWMVRPSLASLLRAQTVFALLSQQLSVIVSSTGAAGGRPRRHITATRHILPNTTSLSPFTSAPAFCLERRRPRHFFQTAPMFL